MGLQTYEGPRGTTYGYRFMYHGVLHKEMLGPGATAAMARDAEQKERARLAMDAFEGSWGPLKPRRMAIEDAAKRFVETKAHKRTVDQDESRLRWWAAFLAERGIHHLQEIDPDSILAGRHQREKDGHAPGSIYQYFAVLRALCRMAVRRWKAIRESPFSAIDVQDWPKPKPKDVRFPTKQEFRKLLEKADTLMLPIILTAVYTGMREGAVIKIQAEDRRYRKGWLRGNEEKGDDTVWIFETPELKMILDSQGVKTGPLFRWEDGRPMTRFPRKRWNAARAAAGIPWFDFHDLRHMAGHLLAESDVPMRTIGQLLGQSSNVTKRYTQGLTKTVKAASKKLAREIGVYRNLNRRTRNSL
jgi:integrase